MKKKTQIECQMSQMRNIQRVFMKMKTKPLQDVIDASNKNKKSSIGKEKSVHENFEKIQLNAAT